MIGFAAMMPAGAFSRKATFVALFGVLAALTLAVALPRAEAGAAAPAPCPTFRVLHNDRIGKVILPAGTYNVKIAQGSGLSCAKASALFTRFLEDYDGILSHQWHARQKGASKAAFIRKGKRRFSVIRASAGVGGGQGGSLGSLCPGKFHVLHNDHIGPLSFPAGFYQLYIPRHSVISCPRANALFTKFLALPSGRLPHGWRLKSQRAVFFRAGSPAHKRFRVDPGT